MEQQPHSAVSDTPIIPPIPQLPHFPPTHSSSIPIGPLSTVPGPLLAVEQPMIEGHSTCFICGGFLADDSPKTTIASSDLLPGCSAALLDVLGAALGLGLATDRPIIEMCLNCTKLSHSLDEAFSHLFELRQEIGRLFHANNRPKLTLQLIPKGAGTTTTTTATIPTTSTIPTATTTTASLNLDDLAATRSRRGRRKNTSTTTTTTEFTDTTTTTTTTTTTATAATGATVKVKKKGGRPRKPFPCTICRRKFLTPRAAASHMNRDHHHHHHSHLPPLPSTAQPPHQNSIKTEHQETSLAANAASTTAANSVALKSEIPTPPQPLPPPQPKQTTTNQVLASLRPIQPKPQAVRTQGRDGSLLVVVNSSDSTTALISMTPNYPGLKTHAGGHTHTCETCGKVFNDEKSRKMHKIAAHGRRKQGEDGVHASTFVCKACSAHDGQNVSFPTRRELSTHKRASHPRTQAPTRYSCTHCSAVFAYKYELNRHSETHMPYIQTNAHEFVCRLCGLHVASRAALKIHVHRFHTHDTENPHTEGHDRQKQHFLCASCGHLSRTRKAFTDHQRSHNSPQNSHEKTVTCKLCQKVMLGSSFRTHVRRMHGEARYTCGSCGDKFCVRSDLMRHVNTQHSALKPYLCDVHLCAQAFSTSDALRYHRNKVHSTTTHSCNFCPKTYKWKGELRTHIQRVHTHTRERFSCSLCTRSYADRRKLRHHLAVKHGEESIGKEQQPQQPQQPTTTATTTTTTTTIDNHHHHHHHHLPATTYHEQPQQQQPSIVTIPIYQHSEATSNAILQPANELPPTGLNGPMREQEELDQPIAGEIYLVPNLSVPIHEEQVSTS